MSSPADRRLTEWPAVAFASLFPAAMTWAYFVAAAGCPQAAQRLIAAAGKVVQFGFPVLWLLLVRRERPHWPRRGAAGVGTGIAFGLLVFAVMLGVYHLWLKPTGYLDAAGQAISQKVAGFGLDSPAAFVALGVFYSLAHSLLEEYYWRWFVFGRMRNLMPWAVAMGVSSLAFMAHHVILLCTFLGWASAGAWLFSFAVAVGGAVWCWLYQRSGSLLGPWLSHLLIDAAIFTVGYDLVF